MTDDGHSPTIPDTQAPTHGPSVSGTGPRTPDPRYALRTLLGKGGMGEVWLAHDSRIDRDIAVKMMRGAAPDADLVGRFLREARVQGRLEHPSVVPVHDLGTDPAAPFFAMKRLTGTTLADVLAAHDEHKWPRRTLLTRFVDVCLAVEFAHARGVIHRDLKPANIMLGDYGEAYVLDWGLARIAGDPSEDGVIRASDLPSDPGASGGHTEAGAMLGTPGYMSPEQMRGESIDTATDIYALGCILFEILTGSPAVPRDRALEVTLASASHRPALRMADVPPELDAVCARATAAARGDRHPNARALADDVQRFLDGDRDLEMRRTLSAQHTARARDLAGKPDIESRAEAMREAGSAIALDAGNRTAHGVLMQLLLEPPKELPPEVRRKIEDERQAAFRPGIAGTCITYIMSLAILVAITLLGTAQTLPLLMLYVEVSAMIAITGIAMIKRLPMTTVLYTITSLLHATVLGTVGIGLGPLLVLPILLFGSMPIMVMSPVVRIPKILFALHFSALLVPLLLEWLHILPPTYRFEGNALVLEPWAVTLPPLALIISIVAVVFLQLVGIAFILGGLRREQDRAQETVHLQSWQFAQLVRSSGSTPEVDGVSSRA